MRVSHHVVISLALSGLVWLVFKSVPAAVACFMAGVFIDADHVLDYLINFGLRLKPGRHLFTSFEDEPFDTLFIGLHGWEWIGLGAVIVVALNGPPVGVGLLIGAATHLLLDTLFNRHSPLGYFFGFRLKHGFSAPHFYGAHEYRIRLRRVRTIGCRVPLRNPRRALHRRKNHV